MGRVIGVWKMEYGKTIVSSTTERPGAYSTFILWDDGTKSPIFGDLAGLYPWMRQNVIVIDESATDSEGKNCYIPWRVRKD
jgi:hypothetical protein